MKVLPAGAPAPRGERPGTALLHAEPNLRVVRFHLLPGQQVPPHSSPSSVLVTVVAGRGTFRGEGGEAVLGAGETAVYAPGEPHSIQAGSEPLHFVAVLAPSPA